MRRLFFSTLGLLIICLVGALPAHAASCLVVSKLGHSIYLRDAPAGEQLGTVRHGVRVERRRTVRGRDGRLYAFLSDSPEGRGWVRNALLQCDPECSRPMLRAIGHGPSRFEALTIAHSSWVNCARKERGKKFSNRTAGKNKTELCSPVGESAEGASGATEVADAKIQNCPPRGPQGAKWVCFYTALPCATK